MGACFLFGISYISLTSAFAMTEVQWELPIIFSADSLGGLLMLVVLVSLSVVPTIKIYYRDLGLFCLYTTCFLTFSVLFVYIFQRGWQLFREQGFVLFFQIFYSTIPPINFFVFFNLSYSLSAQHTAFYLLGMEFSGLVISFFKLFEHLGSPAWVLYAVLLLINVASLVLFIVLFYFIKDVYSLLKSQKVLTMADELIEDSFVPPWKSSLRLLFDLLSQKKKMLTSVFLSFVVSKTLFPSYLELKWSGGHPQARSFDAFVALLYFIGVAFGRALLFVPKRPSQLFVFLASIAQVVFAFPTVLTLYFMTLADYFPITAACITAMVLALGFGVVNGYLTVCAIDLSLNKEEPRVAVTVVSLALYSGVFAGTVFVFIISGVKMALHL